MTEHDGRAAKAAARRGLPAWVYFTGTALLTIVVLIALALAHGHMVDGGGPELYVLPVSLGALWLLTATLGYRRLKAGPGHIGRQVALLILGTVVVSLAAAHFHSIDDSPEGVVFEPWMAMTVIAFSLWVSIAMWRNLDEAAREAHKWALYWGSGLGVLAAMPLFLFEVQSERWRAALGISDTFENGAMSLLLLQMGGYLLAWLFWWARRR